MKVSSETEMAAFRNYRSLAQARYNETALHAQR